MKNIIAFPIQSTRTLNIVRNESATIIILAVIRTDQYRAVESERERVRRSLRLATKRAALRHTAQRANAEVVRAMIDDDLFHNGEPVPR